MFAGVASGAFGAHALKAVLDESSRQTWQTATEYLFYHALGLIGLSLWLENRSLTKLLRLAGWSLLIGCLIFSGSLYLMVLTNQRWLGMVTPFGGVMMLVGWLSWSLTAIKEKSRSS
jgi:uncharacterized membrane protein YgdD (TMEM256/DUF423 family)